MSLINCSLGHYYDDEKYSECPFCKKAADAAVDSFDLQSRVTVSGYKIGSLTGGVTELLGSDELEASLFDNMDIANQYDAVSDENSTIGYFQLSGIGGYTAGWLVCVAGADKGKSFTIEIGRNLCGSGLISDICIGDSSVAEKSHCSFIYEPKQNRFYVTPENGTVFHNEKFISEVRELHSGDKVGIGETTLIFVPFCNENRRWDI